jgi:hypothetical protein
MEWEHVPPMALISFTDSYGSPRGQNKWDGTVLIPTRSAVITAAGN